MTKKKTVKKPAKKKAAKRPARKKPAAVDVSPAAADAPAFALPEPAAKPGLWRRIVAAFRGFTY